MEKITKFIANNESDIAEPEISRYGDGYRCNLGQKNHADILEDYVELYGLSDKRLRGHIRGDTTGFVLGITCQDRKLKFHSRPEQAMGPIPDEPTVYLLPHGAKSAAPTVCSGSPVSSIVNIIDIRLDKEHPTITISADSGYSGPVVCLNCHI
jgi:hypothetical protein